METKFYLIKELTNTQGQDGSSIAVYPTAENAIVAYHQTCANYHNADDVLYAVVTIHDMYGRLYQEMSETIDHRPAPNA